jgi:hypothetical protein
MSLADRGGPEGRYLVGPTRPNGAAVGVPAQRSEALSRVLSVLEDSWHAIRARHPQIPPVVIIIASGTRGRGAEWGHFAPRRWDVDATGTLAEVLISGEGLRRGPRAVLGTLLHEAAHALAAARGVKDTSRQHRYHNRRFKILAGELGLAVDHDERIGWSLTSVSGPTAEIYAGWLVKLHAALILWRHAEYKAITGEGTGGGTGTVTGVRTSGLIAAACPCGRSIRIAVTTLAAAPVICGACAGAFAHKGPR